MLRFNRAKIKKLPQNNSLRQIERIKCRSSVDYWSARNGAAAPLPCRTPEPSGEPLQTLYLCPSGHRQKASCVVYYQSAKSLSNWGLMKSQISRGVYHGIIRH